jgi:FdhD protein
MAIEVEGSVRRTIFATPTDLDDLVLGHLLGEGIAAQPSDLAGVESVTEGEGVVLRARLAPAALTRLRARLATENGAAALPNAAARLAAMTRGGERRVPPVEVEHAALVAGMDALGGGHGLWRSTGASHAAAWVSAAGDLVLVREDVGRRNALDKLIGAMARAGIDPASGFAAVTSRVSHDLVRQAAGAGIGLLAAMSAPTALAVRLADAAGMTLVGFVRGDSAALYTHPERVRRRSGSGG